MGFQFPLEAVFHLRQGLQHQQENRLRIANQQVSRVGHLLQQTKDRIRNNRNLSERHLNAGTTAAELALGSQIEGSLLQEMKTLDHELTRLRTLRDEQLRLFEKLHRDREILECLRDQQLREHLRCAARREQRRIDDLFLLRRAYLRRGQNVPV